MIHPSESDERLMAHFCAGLDQAFEALYSRYEKRLLNFIYRTVLDASVAEEIFQETWLCVTRDSSASMSSRRKVGR